MASRSSVALPRALAKLGILSKRSSLTEQKDHWPSTDLHTVQIELDPLGVCLGLLPTGFWGRVRGWRKGSPAHNVLGNAIELANRNRLSLVGATPWRWMSFATSRAVTSCWRIRAPYRFCWKQGRTMDTRRILEHLHTAEEDCLSLPRRRDVAAIYLVV